MGAARKRWKVAAVQMTSTEAVQENLRQAEREVRRAAAAGAGTAAGADGSRLVARTRRGGRGAGCGHLRGPRAAARVRRQIPSPDDRERHGPVVLGH